MNVPDIDGLVAEVDASPEGSEIAAFFDFDGTLIDGYSAVAYFKDNGTLTDANIDAEVNRQAAMVAYIDDFWLMMWVTLAAVPLVVLLRPPRPGAAKASATDMGH